MDPFRALVITRDETTKAQAVGVKTLTLADLMPGDVTVRVSHSTINYKDGLAITGTAPVVRRFPMIPGIDFAGTVTASDNSGFKPGDPVVLNGWGLGETHMGAFSQMARVKGDWLIPRTPQGEVRLKKPVVPYWFSAAGFVVLGHGVPGLRLFWVIGAGGILLLWVCWRMYRQITGDQHEGDAASVGSELGFWHAVGLITLADISMSLDNVLAVAGAAKDHPYVLVFGLVLSVLLMGIAANVIARYVERYRWIAWGGLLVILWVAVKMIWEGAHHVAPVIAPLLT